MPLAFDVNFCANVPSDSGSTPVFRLLSASLSAPSAEICVLFQAAWFLISAAWPAVFALTSTDTSPLTSIDVLPVAPLISDCAAS
ncbi:Uncharacterised protein [Burkholderia pseudomallei]|nr:Uncharacterised protein [Burkholderia pseudomallei]